MRSSELDILAVSCFLLAYHLGSSCMPSPYAEYGMSLATPIVSRLITAKLVQEHSEHIIRLEEERIEPTERYSCRSSTAQRKSRNEFVEPVDLLESTITATNFVLDEDITGSSTNKLHNLQNHGKII